METLLAISILACHIACTLALNYLFSCHIPGDAAWNDQSQAMKCPSGKPYHCAKNYDIQFKEGTAMFIEACAMVVLCTAGKEPLISLLRSGLPLDVRDADVFCEDCRDSNQYNSIESQASNTFTQCLYNKQNVCSSKDHKIMCSEGSSLSDRQCRCDSSQFFKPDGDVSMCFEESWIRCVPSNCPLKYGKRQQMLRNYTCAPYCPEGFNRTDGSDECVPIKELVESSSALTTKSLTRISVAPNMTSTEIPNRNQEQGDVNHQNKYVLIAAILITVLATAGVVGFIYVYKRIRNKKLASSNLTNVNTESDVLLDKSETLKKKTDTVLKTDDKSQHKADQVLPNTQKEMLHAHHCKENCASHGISEHRCIYYYQDIPEDERNEFVRKALDTSTMKLLENIEPKSLLILFRQNGTLQYLQIRDIEEEKNTTEQIQKIVNAVRRQGLDGYLCFTLYLCQTHHFNIIDVLYAAEDKIRSLKEKELSHHDDLSLINEMHSEPYQPKTAEITPDNCSLDSVEVISASSKVTNP